MALIEVNHDWGFVSATALTKKGGRSIDYSKFAIPKPNKKKKENNKYIKGKKHRQTKEKEIPKKVKKAVWERDNHKCIFCGKLVDVFYANAHFIPRSAGGLGIEENIFTSCEDCHREQDNGNNTKLYDQVAEKHLKQIYGANWNKKNLIYKKY